MIAKKEKPHQATSLDSLYTPANFYMLRTPALPADLFLQLTSDDGNAHSVSFDDTQYEE